MKRRLTLLTAIVVAIACGAWATAQDADELLKSNAPESAVLNLTVHSDALKRDMNYRVYIPSEYRTTTNDYPVLYLLHGLGGSEKNWSDPKRGNMQEICDEWFAAHPDQKRVVVMPDGGNRWYRDSLDDSSKYETFFFDELIPDVKSRFRIKDDQASRAIAGLSMGGYGSALYALRRPDYFAAAVPMSAAIRTVDELKEQSFEEFKKRYSSGENMEEGETRFDDYFYANDPHTLVTKLTDEQKKSFRMLLDCGDDDDLLVGNIALFNEARKSGVKCELRVRDGGHAWQYWRESLPIALEFIAQ